jgi:hypothetical protein
MADELLIGLPHRHKPSATLPKRTPPHLSWSEMEHRRGAARSCQNCVLLADVSCGHQNPPRLILELNACPLGKWENPDAARIL